MSTTCGDIEVEFWSKEAPKAVRNFIQLSLESYFNNTVFHRLVKDFIVQGGDPTGTGDGGESIYEGGKPFKDEFHSRLRFVRRGLLAMANCGRANDNQSQFFFTLGPTPELQNKHTIFGTIVGDSLYNAMTLNESETDFNDRVLRPHRINSIKIVDNPFDDIVPRKVESINNEAGEVTTNSKKEATAIAKRNTGLLSFGDEDEEECDTYVPVKLTVPSDHLPPPNIITKQDIPPTARNDKKDGVVENVSRKFADRAKHLDKSDRAPEHPKRKADNSDDAVCSTKNKRTKASSEDHSKNDATDKSVRAAALNIFSKGQAGYKRLRDFKNVGSSQREQQTLKMLAKFEKKLTQANSTSVKNMACAYDSASDESPDEISAHPLEPSIPGVKKPISDGTSEIVPVDASWLRKKLTFETSTASVLDASITDVDSERYTIIDPRNPMVKRRNENAAQNAKSSKQKRQTDL